MNASTTSDETPPSPSGRRKFLTLCSGAAVVFTMPLLDSLASLRRRRSADPSAAVPPAGAIPGLASFQPHLGSSFTAAATDSEPAVHLTLAKAEAVGKAGGPAGEAFSLRFDAPPGHRIESRIYQLSHPVLGNLELFISPVGSADRFGGQQKGEAIISLPVRAS